MNKWIQNKFTMNDLLRKNIVEYIIYPEEILQGWNALLYKKYCWLLDLLKFTVA